ncbi:MAG: TraR/DksA C4-type zinc finger protein [Steroidobacteraceae bacterium]|nr:TraR/DksA family transcriptional regulator [Nevskiaceae bacterium]MCP5359198.1 TraR/DksA family transcriptional regulator [Nevskiaceae bacterium]MCP5466431.1 TraR/DksA family transcriptional regulator [Nevskiaceae bacterium]MCP5471867.1 TraR/DksA family transcriptional regulator [Nevskiaceae bacterium]
MELETIRKRLLARREELASRAAATDADLRHEHEPLSADFSEQVVQRENEDVLRGLGDAARGELARINRALARIDAGNYLSCAVCGVEIDPRRLQAVPYTDRCTHCAH